MKILFCPMSLALLCVSVVTIQAQPTSQKAKAENQATTADLAEATRLSQLVVSLHKQGKFDEALPLAKRVLEIRQKILGSEHELVGRASENLGSLYLAKKQYNEAAKAFQRSVSVYEKVNGPFDPKLADVLDDLAWSSYGAGDTVKAEDCLQRALAIRKKAAGPDSSEAGEALYMLGMFYQKTGRHSRAVDSLKGALAIKEKTLGLNHKEVADLLEKCACSMRSNGEKREAAEMQKRAAAIRYPRAPNAPVVGGVLQGAARVRVEPVYPAVAKHERISGTVIVEVTVDETGRVLNARSVCGPDLLVEASLDAARKWQFTPTLLSGQPVKVIGTITFNFNL